MPLDDNARNRLAALLARDSNPAGYDEHWTPTPPARSGMANVLMALRDRVPENPTAAGGSEATGHPLNPMNWSMANMLRGGFDHGANSMDVAGLRRDPSTMSAFDAPMLGASPLRSPPRPMSSSMPAPATLPKAAESGALWRSSDFGSMPGAWRAENGNLPTSVMESANLNHRPYGGAPNVTHADTARMRDALLDERVGPPLSPANDLRTSREHVMAIDEAMASTRAYLRATNGDRAEASRLAIRNAREDGSREAIVHAWDVIRLLNLEAPRKP